jgi:hypothetical protein
VQYQSNLIRARSELNMQNSPGRHQKDKIECDKLQQSLQHPSWPQQHVLPLCVLSVF